MNRYDNSYEEWYRGLAVQFSLQWRLSWHRTDAIVAMHFAQLSKPPDIHDIRERDKRQKRLNLKGVRHRQEPLKGNL